MISNQQRFPLHLTALAAVCVAVHALAIEPPPPESVAKHPRAIEPQCRTIACHDGLLAAPNKVGYDYLATPSGSIVNNGQKK